MHILSKSSLIALVFFCLSFSLPVQSEVISVRGEVIWDKTDLFKKRGQRILKDLVRAQEHYVKKGSFKDSNEFMEMDLYPVYYSFVTAKEPPSPGVMDTYREK